jgi:hygromycin-B 7''-O-kinase
VSPRWLPEVPDVESHRVALGEEAPYRRAIDEIARRHRLGGPSRRYPEGACPVFAVGARYVVKLFAPPFTDAFENEREILAHVEGRLGVATPAVAASGMLDDWHYLVMTQLEGRTLRELWGGLARADQLGLARALGDVLRRLHALPTDPIRSAVARPDWTVLVDDQRARCVERQAAHGAPEVWLARIPAFLSGRALDGLVARAAPTGDALGVAPRHALLHTEILREHVLAAEVAGTWRLTGLVDFERSMIAPIEYELAAVGLFFSEGDPEVLRALLVAYGLPAASLAAALRRRVLACALLHRHSNLAWFLERLPPAPGTTTFEELADQWWAT